MLQSLLRRRLHVSPELLLVGLGLYYGERIRDTQDIRQRKAVVQRILLLNGAQRVNVFLYYFLIYSYLLVLNVVHQHGYLHLAAVYPALEQALELLLDVAQAAREPRAELVIPMIHRAYLYGDIPAVKYLMTSAEACHALYHVTVLSTC